jgi:hypothetical protein
MNFVFVFPQPRLTPAIRRGKLVFDNWTEGGKSALGVVQSIKIVRNESKEHFLAALAEEKHIQRASLKLIAIFGMSVI